MGRFRSELIRKVITSEAIVNMIYDKYQQGNNTYMASLSKDVIGKIINDYFQIKRDSLYSCAIVDENGIGQTKLTARRVREALTGVDKTVKVHVELDIRFKSWLNHELYNNEHFRKLVSGGKL